MKRMTYEDINSEIRRIVATLVEGMRGPEMILPRRVEAIRTRIFDVLFPFVDDCNITEIRRRLDEDLDRIIYATDRFLEGCDTAALDECVDDALSMLEPIRNRRADSLEKLRDNVRHTLPRRDERVRRVVRDRTQDVRGLREENDLQAGDVSKLANDSLDVAVDSYFDKAGETLDATGAANKERGEDGEGEQEFSAVDFASDIANLVDRLSTLLDLEGTIARRAVNHVAEKYGTAAAENVKQVLAANFDIETVTDSSAEDDREEHRPVAVGAGGEASLGGGGGAGATGAP